MPVAWRHRGMMLHVSPARSGAAPTKSLTMRLSLRPEWHVRYADGNLHGKETWLGISREVLQSERSREFSFDVTKSETSCERSQF